MQMPGECRRSGERFQENRKCRRQQISAVYRSNWRLGFSVLIVSSVGLGAWRTYCIWAFYVLSGMRCAGDLTNCFLLLLPLSVKMPSLQNYQHFSQDHMADLSYNLPDPRLCAISPLPYLTSPFLALPAPAMEPGASSILSNSSTLSLISSLFTFYSETGFC